MPMPPPPGNGLTAISNLSGHGTFANIVGVIVSVKEIRKTKGSDWVLDFTVQDDFSSGPIGGSSSTRVCVFRSGRDKFPKTITAGDVALLRKVKLNSWGARTDCVSDSTAVAEIMIFPANKIPAPEQAQSYQLGTQRLPYESVYTIGGEKPPTAQEQVIIMRLKHAASGSVQQVQQHAVVSSFKPAAREKLSLIQDLDFSLFYDVRAQIVNIYYTNLGTLEIKVTDYTSNKSLFYYPDPESGDAHMITNNLWKGPYGFLTLSVVLYGNNAAWVRENLSSGDYIFLKNLRTKLSPLGNLEGVIHEDRERPDQVDVRKLTSRADIDAIDKRREAYESKRGSNAELQSPQRFNGLQNGPKKSSAKAAATKKAQKRQRERDQKEADLKEIEEKSKEWDAERNGVNTNVQAAFPEKKLSTISEIIYTPHLQAQSTKYNNYTLPFVNAKHRARVRVVDVFPSDPVLFAHCTGDPMWSKKSKKKDPTKSQSKDRWEWGFVLLLEDANVPPRTVSEKLRVVVGNDVGQGLLNENAVDLKSNPKVLQRIQERLFILWGNLLELKTELRDRGSDLPLPPGDNRLHNLAFDCCIEEYGHEVPITDENPSGYQRMHKLAQTHIKGIL